MFAFSAQGNYQPQPVERFILVVINSNLLYCPLCEKMMNDFCRKLGSEGLEDLTMGIFVPNDDHLTSQDKKGLAIIEKQLRGYIKGNNIRFPILVDTDRIFAEICSKDADVLLFDGLRHRLRMFKLPLTQDQWQEIISR